MRFRLQILTMVTGLFIPVIGSFLYVSGLSPYGIDLGPISMSISFIFHGLAILSFKMFDVAPIARETVFESMEEGVIFLNQNEAIVDFNKAMLKVIPILQPQSIGKTISVVLNQNPELSEVICKGKESDFELNEDEKTFHYHIRFTPVFNKNNQQVGKIITFVNVTNRVFLAQQLKQLASMDGLTQILNRTYFIKRAERMIESLTMNGGRVSLIMFDIDHFKKVNDTYGHEAGDFVLKHVASLVKECLRGRDIIGRYGGEEFVICLPDTPLEQAQELAEMIRIKVSNSYIVCSNKEIFVTSSFGVTSLNVKAGGSNQTIDVLMRQADQALYAAKQNGRNCVQSFEKIWQSL